jgi:ribosome maturation factor RimP
VTTTTTLQQQLITLIEPAVAGLGYELVDLEFVPGRACGTLRVFIDLPALPADAPGIGIEDCTRVSHSLSELLDVSDPIPTAYTLEVSSPGFDRRLRTRAHFERFLGARVHVELAAPRAGRRRYTGRLAAVDAAGIRMEVDREQVAVPLAEIGKARLAP